MRANGGERWDPGAKTHSFAKKRENYRCGGAAAEGGPAPRKNGRRRRAAKEEAMIRPTGDLRRVKEEILSYYKQDVLVHVDLGRNKSADFTGKLTGVYPALFTVTPDDAAYRGKTAYSYSEILCGSVRVTRRG